MKNSDSSTDLDRIKEFQDTSNEGIDQIMVNFKVQNYIG